MYQSRRGPTTVRAGTIAGPVDMTKVLLFPLLIIGILSVAVMVKLAVLSRKHKVPFGMLLHMFFRGMPVGLLCQVKGEMEDWGLIIEMSEILDVYLERLAQGGKGYAAMAEEIRQGVIKARTGRA
jgi:hypothetical protein